MNYSKKLKLSFCVLFLSALPFLMGGIKQPFFSVDPGLESWLGKQSTASKKNTGMPAGKIQKGKAGHLYSMYVSGQAKAQSDVDVKTAVSFEQSYIKSLHVPDSTSFLTDKTGSCRDFASLDNFATKAWIQSAELEDFKDVFRELASYLPNRRVRNLYRRIFSNTSSALRKDLFKKVSVPQSIKPFLVSKIPSLLDDVPGWLAYEPVAIAAVSGSCERKVDAATLVLRKQATTLQSLMPIILKNGRCFFGKHGKTPDSATGFFSELQIQGVQSVELRALHGLYKAYVAKGSPSASDTLFARKAAEKVYEKQKPSFVEVAQVFFAGRVLDSAGTFEPAIKAYSFVAEHKKLLEKEWVRKNMQRFIVLLYQNKNFDRIGSVAEEYKQYAKTVLGSDNAVGFSMFWQGRALFAKKKKDAALKLFQSLAKKHFSSFYGAMAHAVLHEFKVPLVASPHASKQVFSKAWLYKQFSPSDKKRLDWVQTLGSLGESKSVQCEISFLQPAGRIEGFYAAKAILMSASGDYLGAIKSLATLDHYDRGVLPLGIETVFFPMAYRSQIEHAASQAGIDPVLPLSIIRQESVFNPLAVSPAGAVGLMQLMPATAKAERRSLSSSYIKGLNLKSTFKRKRISRSFLKKPENNIAIGVHHLKSLKKKYKHPVFVMTSYNASPSATRRWKNNIPTDDIFYFIESIPYRETQKYVKLLFRNYFYYSQYYYKEKLGQMAMLSPVIEEAFGVH